MKSAIPINEIDSTHQFDEVRVVPSNAASQGIFGRG
jgi:hypothetical protein